MPYQLDFRWQAGKSKVRVKRKRDPNPDERAAYDLHRRREEQATLRALGTMFGVSGAGLGMSIGLHNIGATDMVSVSSGVATVFAGWCAGVWWTLRAMPKSRLRRSVHVEEMRAVFPLLSLSRAERVYCDTLLLLARMELSEEAERTVRQTLAQLNSLLESSRQLEMRRKALLPVLGSNVISELEREYGELGQRLDQTKDSAARQSLMQSLNMCATRLENARQFEAGLERLRAQEEAVVQTLLSAETSLARMQLVPQPQTADAAERIAETVAQINQQTYAVEKAVEEVIQLNQM